MNPDVIQLLLIQPENREINRFRRLQFNTRKNGK
jgi:hypothetical protein